MSYELPTPEHVFVPVAHQTGCARCGYARGHHPTARQMREEAKRARQVWAAWYDRVTGKEQQS